MASQAGRDGIPDFESVADVIRHLGDGTRLRLLLALAVTGEQSVARLCEALAAPQPAVSHHLGILRRARIVRTRRQGREIHYRLDDSASVAPNALRLSVGGATLLIESARRAAGGKGAGLVVAAATVAALAAWTA